MSGIIRLKQIWQQDNAMIKGYEGTMMEGYDGTVDLSGYRDVIVGRW